MTWQLSQGDIWMSTAFQDVQEDVLKLREQVKFNTDLATTIAAAQAHTDKLAAFSLAAVNDFYITFRYSQDAPEGLAGDVGDKADIATSLIVVPPAQLTQSKTFHFPAPVDAVKVATTGPGANLVNITDAVVTALMADYQNGGSMYTSHGQEVLSVLGGVIVNRD